MKRQDKHRSFFFEHRFAVFFFLYVVLYNYLIVNRLTFWKTSDITYAYHLVDFRLGFRASLLPGAIFNSLFGQHVSRTTATVYETVLLLLFFAGVAVLLDRLLCRVEQEKRRSAFLLILFYLSGPFTFSAFTDGLGMRDVYWLFFSWVFCFILDNKGFRFLIPILFGLSLLVHFSSVLNYLLLFSILLLYRISIEPQKNTKRCYILIFILSILATSGLFLFFLSGYAKDLPLSIDEFHQMLQEKGSNYFLYYDSALYNIYDGDDFIPPAVFDVESPVLRVIQTVYYRCFLTLKLLTKYYKDSLVRFALTLLLVPVLCLLYKHLSHFMKQAKDNKLKRFSIFLMMVQFPFTAVLGCLLSTDVIRWFTHAFLIHFTMVIYVMYHEEAFRLPLLADIDRLKQLPATWVYFFAYALVNSCPYS